MKRTRRIKKAKEGKVFLKCLNTIKYRVILRKALVLSMVKSYEEEIEERVKLATGYLKLNKVMSNKNKLFFDNKFKTAKKLDSENENIYEMREKQLRKLIKLDYLYQTLEDIKKLPLYSEMVMSSYQDALNIIPLIEKYSKDFKELGYVEKNMTYYAMFYKVNIKTGKPIIYFHNINAIMRLNHSRTADINKVQKLFVIDSINNISLTDNESAERKPVIISRGEKELKYILHELTNNKEVTDKFIIGDNATAAVDSIISIEEVNQFLKEKEEGIETNVPTGRAKLRPMFPFDLSVDLW